METTIFSYGNCVIGMTQTVVRVISHGDVRHGSSIIPPVLLGAHAACRCLATPKLKLCKSLSRAYKVVHIFGTRFVN